MPSTILALPRIRVMGLFTMGLAVQHIHYGAADGTALNPKSQIQNGLTLPNLLTIIQPQH
jgi:hypothetical protein